MTTFHLSARAACNNTSFRPQRPNGAFKPKLHRNASHMAEETCHVPGYALQFGLTWALGPVESQPMDIAILAAAVIGYLQVLSDDRRFNKEQRQAARVALSDAFHETEGYYAD